MLLMLVIYELPLLVLWWHGVKLGPGPQELGPWDSGTQDPPQNLKVRPRNLFFNPKVQKGDPHNGISSLFYLLYSI